MRPSGQFVLPVSQARSSRGEMCCTRVRRRPTLRLRKCAAVVLASSPRAGWAEHDQVLADFGLRDAAVSDFRSHDEVALWFEHDLYDQSQLLQILDRFAALDLTGTVLTLVAAAEYLGPASPDRLRQLYGERRVVTAEVWQVGRSGWQAFCSPDPSAIAALLKREHECSPLLSGCATATTAAISIHAQRPVANRKNRRFMPSSAPARPSWRLFSLLRRRKSTLFSGIALSFGTCRD